MKNEEKQNDKDLKKLTLLLALALIGNSYFYYNIVSAGKINIEISQNSSNATANSNIEKAANPIALSDKQTQNIFKRLEALPDSKSEQSEFKLPNDPLPPPLTGTTVKKEFPPKVEPLILNKPNVANNEELEVLRYSPKGEIKTAPFISISFNQAMVPITTLENLSKIKVPVKITPEIAGSWQWLGTKTLTFEHDSKSIDRLPNSTKFFVNVPKDTKSLTRKPLSQDVSWTFTTTTAKVVSFYPQNSRQPLSPLFFVKFNQQINPQNVLNTIIVKAGNKNYKTRLATKQEIDDNKNIQSLIDKSPKNNWISFKTTEKILPNSKVKITVGPNVPSAEGSLLSLEAQNFSFSTYPPLKVVKHNCRSSFNNKCYPLSPLYIRFNNKLDVDDSLENKINISPKIDDVELEIRHNNIVIKGQTKGQQSYTVNIDKDITDIYGQKLAKNATVTFDINKARPQIFGQSRKFITLDPFSDKGQKNLSIYSINNDELDIEIYKVKPKDWHYFNDYQKNSKTIKLPGKLLIKETRQLTFEPDTLGMLDINLSKYTINNNGQFIVKVSQKAIPKPITDDKQLMNKWLRDENSRQRSSIIHWVQISPIALDAINVGNKLITWATDFKTGKPLPQTKIQIENSTAEATDINGIATFTNATNHDSYNQSYIFAQSDDFTAMLPLSIRSYSAKVTKKWFVFDDRGTYRPGEKVHIKGWIRKISPGANSDVELYRAKEITYIINDATGNKISQGKVQVNSFGGFNFIVDIPKKINLGNAQVMLKDSDSNYRHSFNIQEFRRPEFEVTTKVETTAPHIVGDSVNVLGLAKYYTGDSLSNAKINWNVQNTISSYTPPKWDKFTFGNWRPVWYRHIYPHIRNIPNSSKNFQGKTDANGEHKITLDLNYEPDETDKKTDKDLFTNQSSITPFNVSANASVTDVNRQAWNSKTQFLVHPASVYIGLRSASYFVEPGKTMDIEYIVSHIDGEAVSERKVSIEFARIKGKYKRGKWINKKIDIQNCKQTSGSSPQTCSFTPKIGGTYQITAEVWDKQNRINQTRITRWVSGGNSRPAQNIEQEKVILIPNQESYKDGDIAEILVQSPFSSEDKAYGLMNVTRAGLVTTENFVVGETGSYILRIPIYDKYVPNLNIQVNLTGISNRHDNAKQNKDRPAYAVGNLTLKIPPISRTLTVDVTPAVNEIEPAGKTNINMIVNNSNGEPVNNSEIALIVVDEAILALSNYKLADPLEMFYYNRNTQIYSTYARESIVLINPKDITTQANELLMRDRVVMRKSAMPMKTARSMAMNKSMDISMAMEGASSANSKPIAIRSNFNPLAIFAPTVKTDKNGMAKIAIKLPDNLTRYRIIAIAVDNTGKLFGKGTSNLTARLPLMVRPSAPRFLNFGDKFELPVIVQNQTNELITAKVVARANNLEIQQNGFEVNINPHTRIEVRFPASTISAGSTSIQIAALSGNFSDASNINLPIYTPATTEAFATYGIIDNDNSITRAIQFPSNTFSQYGGLEISTSSTALQSVTDAFLYLINYPYECSEQLSSRILSIAALRDVLSSFRSKDLPSPEHIEEFMLSSIQKLQSLQNSNGGFPIWRRGKESNPYNSVHTAHALLMANDKGYKVSKNTINRSLAYLKNIENYYPHWYSENTRNTISSYALFVRAYSKDVDSAKAERLFAKAGLENLSLDSIGWLWTLIKNEEQLADIRKYVNNRIVETAGAANFTNSYREEKEQNYLLLGSSRKSDAIILNALILDNPKSDLIPKIVKGLMAHKKKGRWRNTQENIFVLLAIDKYFKTFENQPPDFVTRIWLGDSYTGEHKYKGYSNKTIENNLPMSFVQQKTKTSSQNLIIAKEGVGRLYYRLGMRYAPTNLNMPSVDNGFIISRSYEGVDNPDDVRKNTNGQWEILAGSKVRVKIKMVADNRRYHVALTDPLPAGLEIINLALAVSGGNPDDDIINPLARSYGWWWSSTWYQHQNLRDNKAEAFTTLLWDGVYNYNYIARATTPGAFIVPPTKAEEMYSPEVFGRSKSDIVIIK